MNRKTNLKKCKLGIDKLKTVWYDTYRSKQGGHKMKFLETYENRMINMAYVKEFYSTWEGPESDSKWPYKVIAVMNDGEEVTIECYNTAERSSDALYKIVQTFGEVVTPYNWID